MLVVPLYDRLLGLTLGLTHVAQSNPQITADCEFYLQSWATGTIEIWRQLHHQPVSSRHESRHHLIRQAVTDRWTTSQGSELERVFALALGVFCWCDDDDALLAWRQGLSADSSEEMRRGLDIFMLVLRSFLREPPGRTVWLPLKRKTVIADLKAYSPKVLLELQRSQSAGIGRSPNLFLTNTAIACQLPWYSSACKLAQRQSKGSESRAIIGVLLGAAFGPIAFQEDIRATKQVYDAQQLAAEAIAPLWQLWTGSGDLKALNTVSLASAM